ncbi:Neutral/alkaline nonlysosomal ceramidase [Mycena epipterygia]|nr:Neutral/alkaline nonlysosomal ceramidase [Mycena epipterygia]
MTRLFSLLALSAPALPQSQYLLGLGIADTDTGLHQRQRARAFIVGEPNTPANRIVFINANIAMGDTGIRSAILAELATKYGTLYTAQNFALSSTHQHSGSFDAIVQGVVLAVDRAHASLAFGTLSVGNTSVTGGNINRSPTAYLANPAAERALYVNEGSDQDKIMSLLSFGSRGFLSFFPVHGTSIYEMLKVGNFVVPGELTTISGRRLRAAVRAKLISAGIIDNSAYVVVAGPANTYAHYITTREEYAIQRYEGASTIFGNVGSPALLPIEFYESATDTLEAYTDKYTSFVLFLADTPSGTPSSDAAPPELTSSAISLQVYRVVFDAAPSGKSFGHVLIDVTTTAYHAGSTVLAQFVGENPWNNLRLENTFLSVDQLVSRAWKTVKSDSHPLALYQWTRISTVLATSSVNVSWTIATGMLAGTYRLRCFGDSKPLIGSISAFNGTSSNFSVLVRILQAGGIFRIHAILSLFHYWNT